MREAIIELYMRIFTCQAEAYKYLQQNKVYHAFRSFGDNASHPIKKTLDAIEEQILKIDGLERLEDRQTMLEHHQDLLSKLEKLQEPLIRIGERLDNVVDVLNEAKKLKIRDWISVVPVMDHHRSVVGEVMPDSGQWLLRNAKFLEWRSQSSSSVLWLHGMVGCGKSTLASIIIEYVEQKERVAYYYCNQREENRRKDLTDPTTVLRSLVRQLSFSGPKSSAPSDVIDKYDSAGSLGHLTEDECVGAITHLTNSYPLTTIVVDALDGYGDEDALAGFLQHLYKVIKTSTSLVKVLLTSRNMPTIENIVKEENLSVFDISILSTDNKLDIYRYAQEKVDEYKKSRRRLFGGPVTDRFAAEIVALLTVRAEGMFLWVALSVNMVYKGTNEEAVREILQVLPKDLEKLYGMIFDSIEENCIASSDFRAVKQTLKWLLCAKEVLDGNAMLAAISLEERPLSDPLFQSSTRTKESLISLCRNFVEEDKGDFRIAHQSVLDFLTKKNEFSNVECHIEIARCCLLHLCQSEYNHQELLKPKGLHKYAATFWALHYSAAKEHKSLTNLFQEFSGLAGTTRDQDTPVSRCMKCLPFIHSTLSFSDDIVETRISSSISDEPTSLFAACAFSLQKIFANSFSPQSYANCRNAKGQTALHVACTYGDETIIDLLLRDGNYPIEATDKNGETAIDVLMRDVGDDPDTRMLSMFRKLVDKAVKSTRFVPTKTIIRNALSDSSVWDIIFGAEGVLSANQNPIQYVIDLQDAYLLTDVLIQHPELKPNTKLLSNCLRTRYPDWELCATLLKRGDDFDIDDGFLAKAALGTQEFWEALLPHLRCKILPDEIFERVLWNRYDGEQVLTVLLQHFSVERLTPGMIVAARQAKTFASLGLIIEHAKTHSLEPDDVDIIVRDFPATTIQLSLNHFHDIRLSSVLIEAAIKNTNRGVLTLFLERIPNFDFDDDFLIRAIRQLDRQTLAMLGERRQIQASIALLKRVFSQSFGYDSESFNALLELPRDFQLSDEICIEILSGGAAYFSSKQLEALLEPPNSLTGKLLGPFLLRKALSRDYSQEETSYIISQEETLDIILKRKNWLRNFEINETLKFMLFREAKSLRSIEELLGAGFLITDQLAEAAAGNRQIGHSLLQRWLHSTPSTTITESILKASKDSDKGLLLLLAQPCPLPMGQGVLEALLPGSDVRMVEAILLRKEITSINAQILMAVNESEDGYFYKTETLSVLSKDSRLERTEEVAIVLASFRYIQPMLEHIQHTPSFKTTDRILQAAIVNFNMVTVLLPMWNGQVFTESILKRALKYSGDGGEEKIGVARQIVAKGKKVELSQAVIKYGVKKGEYASLVYLIEHQGSIDIDLKLLEWVAMNGKHETADVFGALIKHQSYGYFSTKTMLAAAIKNGRFMVECVLRHVRSEDWNNVVTDSLLVSAVKQWGEFKENLNLIELFLKYAPIPDVLVTSTFILLLINSMGPAEEGIDLERVDDVNDYSGSDDNGGESDGDEGDDAFIDEGESERADKGNDFSGRTNSDDVGYDRFVDEEGADIINDDLKCNDEEGADIINDDLKCNDEEGESDGEDDSRSEEDDNDITVSYTWDLDLTFDLLPLMTSCPRDDTKEIARVVREMAEKAQYPLSKEHTRHLYKMLGYGLEPSSKLEE